jgi:2-amino-4-hydroxy-6-hydroxymethyldihydropteridine diphosphokinase
VAKVYIAIGTNLGDRRENCKRALTLLAGSGICVLKSSSVYETEPWGVEEQPMFLNMVVEAETSLKPLELLSELKSIEEGMGRVEPGRWGPRLMDLDILLYEAIVLDEPDLVIPHPLLHERDFVLTPLLEIAPEVWHPILRKTIREIAALRARDVPGDSKPL